MKEIVNTLTRWMLVDFPLLTLIGITCGHMVGHMPDTRAWLMYTLLFTYEFLAIIVTLVTLGLIVVARKFKSDQTA